MKFALLTPARNVAELTATYIRIPGEAGEFGVLPGHMPLVSTLRAGGVVEVTDEAGEKSQFKVTGGFADVRTDGVTVLAESLE
ncbi:MAG: F0F1 ATP synthase subunit epsilon [Alphaproteobacteria bacterium]